MIVVFKLQDGEEIEVTADAVAIYEKDKMFVAELDGKQVAVFKLPECVGWYMREDTEI